MDIEQKRLKKIVKKNQRHLTLPLNEAAFAVITGMRSAWDHTFSIIP